MNFLNDSKQVSLVAIPVGAIGGFLIAFGSSASGGGALRLLGFALVFASGDAWYR